jgi:hypothetical protein
MTRLVGYLAVGATMAVAALSFAVIAAEKKGVPLTLDPATGYFHQVHTKNFGMPCATCHSSENLDVLFLRKDDVVPAEMPGQVNRSICLGCHKAPAKPSWYGLSR